MQIIGLTQRELTCLINALRLYNYRGLMDVEFLGLLQSLKSHYHKEVAKNELGTIRTVNPSDYIPFNNHEKRVKIMHKPSKKPLVAYFDAEIRLIQSHLVDYFHDVVLSNTLEHMGGVSKFLSVYWNVSNHTAVVTLGKCPNEGYKLSLMYRNVLIYSESTHDKSYFLQLCEKGMQEFIAKFDLKYGRK